MSYLPFLISLFLASPAFAVDSHHLSECEHVWIRNRAEILEWSEWVRTRRFQTLASSVRRVLRRYEIEMYQVSRHPVDVNDPVRGRLLFVIRLLELGVLERPESELHSYHLRRLKSVLHEVRTVLQRVP